MAQYTTPKFTAPKYPTLPQYQAVDYSDKYRNGIDTSFFTNAIDTYTQQANKERTQQIGDAQKNRQAALKQAYVTRLQNEQNLNQNLAQAGIRGGATETANLRLANQYGQSRQSANSDYTNSVNSINQNVDRNIMDYTSDMKSRAEEYIQNQANARWQAAREDAQNKYNASREDAINKYNAAREDAQAKWQAAREDAVNQYNATTEYWSNFYADYYSGTSKKDAKKALKSAQADLKKAKTQTEKIRIQQKIRGIKTRLGVIANK